ncbi:hypothetical protein F2P56_034004 [Juglans regia]|uniref:Uncharacterized protein n=2 Tax=Juglans regia TaxID=51240 RepID=A0A833TPM7_JUGRE|nr:UPF0481 protein At3g47200-like [Juglans regia]KAF5444912.1 hypothetical protein F2P56_034004 [Juglans regia]
MQLFYISEEDEEYRRANYQPPIREFTQQELDIIDEQVTKYSEEAQKLREETDRRSTSCIYKVLPRLKKINGNSLYEPNMVSIGPYYYNLRNEKFKMAEDCKRKCLGSLLVKDRDPDMQRNTYKRCLQKISELEVKIRKCYSEEFEVAGIVFLEMMVLDACFIIKIIEMVGSLRRVDFSESLAALEWMVPYFYRDFLLLENQIPFFVLEEIYALTHNIAVETSRSGLMVAALRFFQNGMKRSDSILRFIITNLDKIGTVTVLHLLDLVRSSLIPSNIRQGNRFRLDTPFIHCISKLRLAGIKVSPGKASSLLEVKFKRGVIKMPNIAIDDLMRCLLLNCVAFEQCHQMRSSKYYFTVYATFLDCLVNTSEDVEYLRERNVIDNYLADDSEAADFINRAGKDLVVNVNHGFYLQELFEDVEKHYQKWWMWKWASFKRVYFDKPWLLLSAAGGILLVLATSFQAVMAFLTYKYKNC